MNRLLLFFGIDRRTPEQKARDGVRKGVQEHEKRKALMAKRIKVQSTNQEGRTSLKVVR